MKQPISDDKTSFQEQEAKLKSTCDKILSLLKGLSIKEAIWVLKECRHQVKNTVIIEAFEK